MLGFSLESCPPWFDSEQFEFIREATNFTVRCWEQELTDVEVRIVWSPKSGRRCGGSFNRLEFVGANGSPEYYFDIILVHAQSVENTIFTISHELWHLIQYHQKRLDKTNGFSFWEDQSCQALEIFTESLMNHQSTLAQGLVAYNNLPWEKEANEQAETVLRQFLNVILNDKKKADFYFSPKKFKEHPCIHYRFGLVWSYRTSGGISVNTRSKFRSTLEFQGPERVEKLVVSMAVGST